MCGICGKITFDETSVSPKLVKAMADTITHRGPDDEGYYVSGNVGLGFRRLSIIDLNTGHQPISNEDGTLWIVFNGEIYNFRELRRQLQSNGHVFRTQTDTEVIVHLYEDLGEACVEQLDGMFAFAIWDERRRTLFLARDRVGIKPLYYRLTERSLIFGSEVKAILADPEAGPEVRSDLVDRFLSFYYLPGEDTLFRDIRKLAPGCSMTVKDRNAKIRQYWDLRLDPVTQDLGEAEATLISILDDAVRSHMIADVPVGFLLSGGVDSTAMLALAVGKTDQSLNSFTLGFDAAGVVDERPYAKLAAKRFGAHHHEMTISAREFADFLPRYSWHMEEPVCEPTAIALYYVSRLAKNYVKVLISGEGGDEAFAGYPNYRNLLWLERFKNAVGAFKSPMSSMLSRLNQIVRSERLGKYAFLMNAPLESYYYSRISSPSTFFNSRFHELYTQDFFCSVSKWYSTEDVRKHLSNVAHCGTLNKMLYVDTKTALPDDLLLKADKMTMANSLELRVPLLDRRVLEFAARLPQHFKVRRLTTKYIAKRALKEKIPNEILNRKKVGFPVPFGSWLRTELKDTVNDVLLDRTTIERGYFSRTGVEKLIAEHTESGRYAKEVLSLVSLEFWHRAFLGKKHSQPIEEPEPSTVVVH